MKIGDLVSLNTDMVTYYESIGRSDLAEEAKSITMVIIDTVTISKEDTDCKLVTCLTPSENDAGTADFHSTDLVVLQKR